MKNKLYLAGPMTGIEGHNFKAFDEAAKKLRDLGFTVVSPADIARSLPGEPGSLPYVMYAREDLKALLDCTDIAVLPGWRNSRGARNELHIADFLRMKCWEYLDGGALRRMEFGDQLV